MSKYNILHTQYNGQDTWKVYYNGNHLKWYHPDVLEGNSFTDVYHKLENAQELIRLHKEHTVWLEEQKKNDVEEWLDEDGTVMKDFSIKRVMIMDEPEKTDAITAGWVCAAVALIILMILVAVFA